MSDIKLDAPLFFKRAGALLSAWQTAGKAEEYASLEGLDALVVLVGDPEEEGLFRKSTALQTWLLGYEFPSTLMVLTPSEITFVCSSGKAAILNQLTTGETPVSISIVPWKANNAATAAAIPDTIKKISETGAGKRVGSLIKEKQKGKLVNEWTAGIAASGQTFEDVDIAPGLSAVMATKDDAELKHISTAARLNSTLMSHYFVEKMASTIEADKKLSHERLAALMEGKIGSDDAGPDMKLWAKDKQAEKTDFSAVDWIFTPIVQSGGEYDLRPSAESNDKNLKAGIILASIGLRVRSYCSTMARTFLIDPAQSQEKNYSHLLDLQKHVLGLMKDGAVVSDVCSKAASFVKDNKPDLEEYFVKTMGSRTGLEFRDATFLISVKNGKKLKEGMVFNLQLAFQGIPKPQSKSETYSLLLIDTVRVGPSGAEVLTQGCKSANDVVFFLNGDEEKKPKSKPAPSPKKQVTGHVVGSKVLRGKTRGEARNEVDESTQVKLKEHQKDLHQSRQDRGLERFAADGEKEEGAGRKVIKKFESYKREDQLPKEVARRRIYVDDARQTVVLPINGYATPFHIQTIKSVVKTEEGEYTALRITFQSPGQIAGKKEDTPFEDPNATFLRLAAFRSTDAHHFNQIYDQITKMRTAATKKEKDKKEMADVIVQDRLVEARNKRPLLLTDVMVKPGLEGKRVAGDVQIHENGIRYATHSGQKVDLLFSNIKHLFFQPCDHELIVIIHVHLKAPILVGKKKAKDVQFSREASDVAFDETGNKKRKYRYGDEDEIELEQEERKRRQALNKEFKAFAEKIAAASKAADPNNEFEVDIPFRELGFQGVPFRTNVLLQPTTDCLVHLTDLPFTVITLNEIEVCHFERVQHGLKQFDLVFVFNDFTRTPLHINSIPFGMLEGIKEWLDSVDIPISEGAVNLSWPAIMKTINEDPYAFFAEGGWGFLGGSGDDGASDESDSASEFEGESDDVAESSASSEEGSDFDEGASDDEGSEEEVSEGEDWDVLESKAQKSDEKKREAKRSGRNDDDSDDGGKKKGRKGR